jgi:predicted O-methyltransferase YrrM
MSAILERWVFPADIDSAVTEDECRKLAELAEGKTVLELGAWKGRSTVAMAQTARRVFSVDWHQGDDHAGEGWTLREYIQNLTRYGVWDRVVPIIGRFEDVLPRLVKGFDLTFIDGLHTTEAAVSDLNWAGIVTDGRIAMHDYNVQGFGINDAANAYFGTEPDEVVRTLAIWEF